MRIRRFMILIAGKTKGKHLYAVLMAGKDFSVLTVCLVCFIAGQFIPATRTTVVATISNFINNTRIMLAQQSER